jgi:hypothetical protein
MTTSSGTELLLHGRRRRLSVGRERCVIRERMGREKIRLTCRRHQRTASLRGLNPQETTGPAQIHKIDVRSQPSR